MFKAISQRRWATPLPSSLAPLPTFYCLPSTTQRIWIFTCGRLSSSGVRQRTFVKSAFEKRFVKGIFTSLASLSKYLLFYDKKAFVNKQLGICIASNRGPNDDTSVTLVTDPDNVSQILDNRHIVKLKKSPTKSILTFASINISNNEKSLPAIS